MKKLKIVSLEKYHFEGVKRLISNSNFQPYRYLIREISIKKVNDFLYNQIIETLTTKFITPYVVLLKDEVLGVGILEELKWDSEIFRIKMAKIRNIIADDNSLEKEFVIRNLIEFFSRECAFRGIKHLSCKINTDDSISISELENNGFMLKDTLLDYAFDFRKNSINNVISSCTIRPLKEGEIESVVEVARNSFSKHFGRFNADKSLGKRSIELYTKWAENACRGYSDVVFVAELNKNIVGYSAWKSANKTEKHLGVGIGSYSIGAVHPNAYGMGIFKALTREGMKWLKGKVDIVHGPTHINNYPVHRGYATLNWKIVNATHTFHKLIGK